MKKNIETDKAPKAIGPYSQAVMVGNTLYCSGQIAIDPESNEFIGGYINSQTEQVIENIKAILNAAGMGMENIIKTTCFLSHMADFKRFNKIYEQHFLSRPARSTVAVDDLPCGALVEIEVIAYKES